jgi:hypothetical protein
MAGEIEFSQAIHDEQFTTLPPPVFAGETGGGP